jgi:hypothetical protein
VVAINWGPWDGGMVTPALRSEFAREGLRLIPLESGARCLVDELGGRADDEVEVLIGASFPQPPTSSSPRRPRFPEAVSSNGQMSVAFERELDVESHAFLQSHVLDGQPVLPAAMIVEWLGHGALHDNPGLVLHGFDDFRILKGVVLESGRAVVHVYATRAERDGDTFRVYVELRSGQPGGRELAHARATVLLAAHWPAPPAYQIPADLPTRPYALSIDAVYRDVLFHGPHFQGLRRIAGISERGMVAVVHPAPPPGEWMQAPLRTAWLGDPLVIDAGLQLGVLWCHQELGALALPSYAACGRQYQPFPQADVTTVLEVRETGPQLMTGDLTFLDPSGKVIACLQHSEWTVATSLRTAFTRNVVVGV